MSRYYSLEHNPDAIPPNDTIHCNTHGCRRQVTSFNNYIPMSRPRGLGLFNWVINVNIANVSNHLGTTIDKTYCSKCEKMIGWRIIAVTQPSEYIKEGRFCMRLDKLSFSNNEQLIRPIQEQNVRANEENADQEGDTTEGYGDSTEEEMSANIEQNVDQDGGLDDDISRANQQNVDQHGGDKEQNHDKDRGANEQTVDKDGGANEQNVDQQEGCNEQNHNQYGGSPMKRLKIE
uniref:ORF_19 n=1 Tax=Solanum tuberosum TaxID=4113 RepID=M1DX46_SOLTU